MSPPVRRAPDGLIELIAHATNDGIWDWNLMTGEVYYSPRWMELVGYGEDALPGRIESLSLLMHPADWPGISAAIDAYLAQRVSAYLVEFRLRHRNGGWCWIQSRGVAVWDAAGHPLRFAGTHTDITARRDEAARLEAQVEARTAELRAINAELVRARDRAEIAAIAKTKFLAAASHDIRQPLQAMALMLDTLRIRIDPGHEDRLLGALNGALDAARGMLDGLLDYSRLDAGAITPARRNVALDALVADVAEGFAETARRRGLDLRIRGARLDVVTDPAMMGRILRNLLANALRYTEAGGVLIACRRRGGRVVVEVWDTGPGIPEEERQSIFWEFHQGRRGGAGAGGLGLGLTIVDGLCRLLGHEMALASRVGRGSVFRIAMPLAPAIAGAPPVGAEAHPVNLAGLDVIVIENDAAIRDALAAALTAWGCAVTAVADEPGFLDAAARNGRPGLILADRHLDGGVDGLDLLSRAALLWPGRLPAMIVLTGDTDHAAIAARNTVGARVLHKPVPAALLRAMIAGLTLREAGRSAARSEPAESGTR
ncbi:PAS domain-containing protein [Tistrella mobilis]|uniref:ATP-binding protein n=1 Tax=Tistrella mobilis TaxID=171437 RepID=UPI0035580601